MIKIIAILASIITIIGGVKHMIFGETCLETNCYSADVSETGQNLNLQLDFARSDINFIKHKITKEGTSVFINIYGKHVNDSAHHSDFNIKYLIPDGVNKVYMRGNTNNDLKLIWENV